MNLVPLAALAAALPAGCFSIHSDIELALGERVEHPLSTVNGPIRIETGARVGGDAEAVNNRVVLAKDAEVTGTVNSVNGQIRLEGARAGELDNVFGGMVIESGSIVSGELRARTPRGELSDLTRSLRVRESTGRWSLRTRCGFRSTATRSSDRLRARRRNGSIEEARPQS